MRILYITSSLPFGKGESFVLPEMQELMAMGHELFLLPLWPRGRRMHDCSSIATEISGKGKVPSLSSLLRAFPVVRELRVLPAGTSRQELQHVPNPQVQEHAVVPDGAKGYGQR